MKAVILAGGEATRLRPLTCNRAKIMVPVLNRPLLEHFINYLKKYSISDIVLALGKQGEEIRDYFGDGSKFDVNLVCSEEHFSLGTAGAVKNAEGFLDDSFVVFNGDIFTDIDLVTMMSLHRRNKATVSIALVSVDDPSIYGAVETDDESRVKRFLEKPGREEASTNMINAGIYILEPDVMSWIPSGVFSTFERDIFPSLLDRGEAICAYSFESYWLDIGTPQKYLKLHHDLLLGAGSDAGFAARSFACPSPRTAGGVVIGEGCSIDRDSTIKGAAVIGPGCRVEKGALVEGAILWQGCRVGRGARLRNCMLASGCYIGEGSVVEEGCVLGDNVVIGKGNKLPPGTKVWPDNIIEPDTISFRQDIKLDIE